jgi:prepilin-type N-terminal cleavage/methylation domain-containing protein
LTDTKGFSLVEVIAATAILAIIVVMMVSAFVTMSNISARTSGSKTSDSGLEASIAAGAGLDGDEVTPVTSDPLEFTFKGQSFSLPLDADRYSSAKTGSSFTVFGLDSSTP